MKQQVNNTAVCPCISPLAISRRFVTYLAICCLLLTATSLAAKEQLESRESIIKTTRQFIEAKLGDNYELNIQLGYLDKRLRLVKCHQPLEAFFPVRKHNLGATSVGVRCAQPGWKVFVPVQIKAYTKIITARQSLPRGTILQNSDLRIEKREISRFRSGVFTRKSEVIGMTIKRAIASGSVLTPRLVQPRQLVKRGQSVTILAESGGLLIRVKGEALMDGHHGQSIQVKNSRSGKKFTAEVVAIQTVRVKM